VKASSSYKQALAQAYEDELDGVENVVWATGRAIARHASPSTSADAQIRQAGAALSLEAIR
jgi:hypothetical protein